MLLLGLSFHLKSFLKGFPSSTGFKTESMSSKERNSGAGNKMADHQHQRPLHCGFFKSSYPDPVESRPHPHNEERTAYDGNVDILGGMYHLVFASSVFNLLHNDNIEKLCWYHVHEARHYHPVYSSVQRCDTYSVNLRSGVYFSVL